MNSTFSHLNSLQTDLGVIHFRILNFIFIFSSSWSSFAGSYFIKFLSLLTDTTYIMMNRKQQNLVKMSALGGKLGSLTS